MKRPVNALGFAVLASLSPISWSQEISCVQIRTEIKAQSAVLALANTELLRKISGRTECRFTAPEVYRAAYGTKPLPQEAPRAERRNNDDDD